MSYVVLLRHGESRWNLENRFTGWTDVDLSDSGLEQARRAGRLLSGNGYTFDLAYTSYLKRAIRSLWIALDHMDAMWLPVIKDWRLNERHYGALQGEGKRKFEEIYGHEQVHRWRRGFDVRPPRLEPDDPRHPRFEAKYAKLAPADIPDAESLADTVNRVLPCWRELIAPRVRSGEDILVAAHGNSLRALVKYLDGVSDEAIANLDIPLATPRVYEFGPDGAIRRRFYLRERGEEAIGE
ncbi:MAG TPA: 2,3-diphosphoglycerate-dependent phosphoglycerate mutase [Gammaproteobacteria bacterium]|nr:2,3-diphosphoglycerate-dependent phosphoglycerate mutase [Gammaproteobacteria bacterium]